MAKEQEGEGVVKNKRGGLKDIDRGRVKAVGEREGETAGKEGMVGVWVMLRRGC